jgi:hypothetical protein
MPSELRLLGPLWIGAGCECVEGGSTGSQRLARELTPAVAPGDPFRGARPVGPVPQALNDTLGQVTQVAGAFHLVRLANTKLDECRRRVQNETVGPPGPQRRRALSGPAAADQEPRAPSTTVATPSCGAWSTDRLRVPPLRALPHPGLAPRRQAQLGEIPHRYSPLQSDEPCCRSRWFVAVTVGVWVWSHTRLLVGAVMCTVR